MSDVTRSFCGDNASSDDCFQRSPPAQLIPTPRPSRPRAHSTPTQLCCDMRRFQRSSTRWRQHFPCSTDEAPTQHWRSLKLRPSHSTDSTRDESTRRCLALKRRAPVRMSDVTNETHVTDRSGFAVGSMSAVLSATRRSDTGASEDVCGRSHPTQHSATWRPASQTFAETW